MLSDIMQGVPPATVAEWTLQGDGYRDFYDGECNLHLDYAGEVLIRLVSVSCRWIQPSHGYHQYSELSSSRLSCRPRTELSSTNSGALRLDRLPGGMQERVLCESRREPECVPKYAIASRFCY